MKVKTCRSPQLFLQHAHERNAEKNAAPAGLRHKEGMCGRGPLERMIRDGEADRTRPNANPGALQSCDIFIMLRRRRDALSLLPGPKATQISFTLAACRTTVQKLPLTCFS